MSAATHADLDLREQIARIDRAQAETDKFVAETRKLLAESVKFRREGYIQAALAVSGLIGGIVTVIGFVLRLRGVG